MTEAVEGFRVLMVCTGNVCRSAMAERLLRAELGRQLGPGAADVIVTSAGTAALVGRAMEPMSADELRARGGDPNGFAARQLERSMVADADLVLTMTREHRRAVVQLHPAATRRTFTLRELCSIASHIEMPSQPGAGVVDRLRALVPLATAARGVHRSQPVDAQDVVDPFRRPANVHAEAMLSIWSCLDQLLQLVATPDVTPATKVEAKLASKDTSRPKPLPWWRPRL